MPTVFGVIEDDLLFALPVEGIREYSEGSISRLAGACC